VTSEISVLAAETWVKINVSDNGKPEKDGHQRNFT